MLTRSAYPDELFTHSSQIGQSDNLQAYSFRLLAQSFFSIFMWLACAYAEACEWKYA